MVIKYNTESAGKRFFRENEFAKPNHPEIERNGETNIMPLILAPIGQEMKIVKILADEKTKKHLSNLGVIAQSEITVLSSSGGSTVCIVKDGRLALDRDVASRIFVA